MIDVNKFTTYVVPVTGTYKAFKEISKSKEGLYEDTEDIAGVSAVTFTILIVIFAVFLPIILWIFIAQRGWGPGMNILYFLSIIFGFWWILAPFLLILEPNKTGRQVSPRRKSSQRSLSNSSEGGEHAFSFRGRRRKRKKKRKKGRK